VTTQQSETIEIGHVVRTVVRGWRAILCFTVLGIIGAAAVIRFAPRKFTGVTTVLLKSSSGGTAGSSVLSQVTGLGDITAGLLGGKSPMETEIEVLSSRSVIADVVDSLRLQAKVVGASPLPAVNVIARLDAPTSFLPHKLRFERRAGGKSYQFSGGDISGVMIPGTPTRLPNGEVTFSQTAELPSRFSVLLRDKHDAIDWVSDHLSVAKTKGEVASITYRGDDSLTAARVPNILLDVYFGRRRGTDRGTNQRRVEFLTAKSDSMEKALGVAARNLRQQQEASGVLDPTAVAKADLETGSALRQKLTQVLVEQGALKQLIDQINAGTLSPQRLAGYPQFAMSPYINNLVAQLSDFETRRTSLLASHAETDRDVGALDKSAKDVEARLLPYARTYAQALEKQRTDFEASIATINDDLARLPKAAESTNKLESEVLALTKILGGLQGQIVEAKLAAIGEGGDVRPLDRADAPKKPSFPKPLITTAAGVMGGLFVGLVAALLVGSVGRWVRDPIEIERATGVTALQFDPAVPLLLTNGTSRTIIVAPIEAGMSTGPVASRLAQTAASRSVSAVILDLSGVAADVNATIARLEGQHDLVIVQLPSLVSDSAAAALQPARPVLLVTPGRRTERRALLNAVQLLKRLDVPVAGIVMSENRLTSRAVTG
jgi:uncharacterized protein involved in exopolysaccharide biosynthesis